MLKFLNKKSEELCVDEIDAYIKSRAPEEYLNHSKGWNNIIRKFNPAAVKSADVHKEMAGRLNNMNVNRGGKPGFKGYVNEVRYAAKKEMEGSAVEYLNNNGPVDLIVDGKNVQLKCGYRGNMPHLNGDCDIIVVDQGNTELMNKVARAGYEVEESGIAEAEVDTAAKIMQKSSEITGQATSPIVGTAYSAHCAGVCAAKMTAVVAVPMQAGANIYAVVSGEKTIGEAAKDTAVTGIKTVGGAYASGAVLTVAATLAESTAAGSAVLSAGASVIAAAGATSVGGAVIGTAGAVLGGIAAAPVLPVAGACAGLGFAGSALVHRFSK